jgi:nitrogenase molybdenum-iron protein beta chain
MPLTPVETEQKANQYEEVAESPKFTCALGGAYATALATFGTVPILHSGAGCGMANAHGLTFASGLNTGGAQGTATTPCSCLIEEHVIFGGESKLHDLIESTIELMKGNLFAVISGCVPALIGDDVDAVVKKFKDKAPIIHVKTSGFIGSAYVGYELYFDAIIDELLQEQPKQRKLVNLFGIVPNQHVFWKGDLNNIKSLLERIGVKVNTILLDFDAIDAIQKIPAAELNIVLNPWVGVKIAKKLEERFGTPYEHFQYVPLGPKESSNFLRKIGKRLRISSPLIERVIAQEERSAYRYAEYMSEMFMISLPHAYYAVVADSRTAVEFVKYGANELGWNPEVVVITDNPPEEFREDIVKLLTENLEGVVTPKVFFEIDAHKTRLILKNYTLQVILASSLEKYIVRKEHEAEHLSVAYPVFDRLLVDKSYAGYRGGFAFYEDLSANFAGPL